MTEREPTFHWAFDDQRVAYKCPGWQSECEAPECRRGICRKCHVPVDDRREYCADCVAEDADPRASSFAHRVRADRAEAALVENERVTEELLQSWSREATPLHDQLGRIRMAPWNPDIDGSTFRELVRAVVGHPLVSREDAAAAATAIRAECRRVGIPVADSAEEQIARVRDWAGRTEHGAAAAEVQALIDVKEESCS